MDSGNTDGFEKSTLKTCLKLYTWVNIARFSYVTSKTFYLEFIAPLKVSWGVQDSVVDTGSMPDRKFCKIKSSIFLIKLLNQQDGNWGEGIKKCDLLL